MTFGTRPQNGPPGELLFWLPPRGEESGAATGALALLVSRLDHRSCEPRTASAITDAIVS